MRPRSALLTLARLMLATVALACSSSSEDQGAAGSAASAGSAGAAGNAGNAGNTAFNSGGAGASSTAGSAGVTGVAPDASTTDSSTQCASACDTSTADAAATDSAVENPGGCMTCESYAAPTLLTTIDITGLAEISGIAASVLNPGMMFVHNDRDRAVIYALDMQGALRATFTLTDANVDDVEDLGTGPCEDERERCLYLADIGGNTSPRTEFAILRMREPEIETDEPNSAPIETTLPFERFAFEYDDAQNHNAEGILVDPQRGTVYVVTKLPDGQASSVYRLPSPMLEGELNTAVKVADLPVPHAEDRAASAAAAHPCGTGFVLRTYDAVYEFRIPEGADFESAFSVMPVALASPTEPQSEAISYLPDGSGFITTGETDGAPIFQTACE